ncbi:MAG: hypothetical protein NDJ90_03835 [Oligoflexia bacterium]|nr:hypothetical protein [Oligoflexia bacterium]
MLKNRTLLLTLALASAFCGQAEAKSFVFQHDLVFTDTPGTYFSFSVEASGDLGKYCNFHGYLGDQPSTTLRLEDVLENLNPPPKLPPIQLPASTANSIVIVKEGDLNVYEDFEGNTQAEFVTKIAAAISGHDNSFVVAVCAIPATRKWLTWMPIDRVPSLQELRTLFRDHFLIGD